MKTRFSISKMETISLLNLISTYGVLTEKQLLRFFPDKAAQITAALKDLTKQKRVFYNAQKRRYAADAECDKHADEAMLAAIWVLLDLYEHVEYHLPCDGRAKLCFFADGKIYEVLYIPAGHEALFNNIYFKDAGQDTQRIVIVENTAQAAQLRLPNVMGFCTVSSSGDVQYFLCKEGAS